MKRNSLKLRFFAVAAATAAWMLSACATTTIQTGGNQYHPRDFSQREPEERFFNALSEQDAALQEENDRRSPKNVEKKSDEIALATKDCPCDTKKETAQNSENRSVRLNEYIEEEEKEQDSPAYHKEAIAKEDASQKTTPVSSTDGVIAGDGKYRLSGTASWYGRDFDGKLTASGEPFDSRKLTAAHKTIPLGSIVLVRNLENNKEILVTINDRGPYVGDRILDVSEYGAELLGYKEQGLTQVELKIIRLGKDKGKAHGATYNFFGNGSESGSMGAGDDPKANQEIDRLLSREAVEPAPRKAAKNKRNDLVPESRQSGYAVQVGVFDDLRNARQLQNYLQKSSVREAQVRIYKRRGQYAVKIGEFSDRSEADAWKTRMIQEGYHAFVSGPQ